MTKSQDPVRTLKQLEAIKLDINAEIRAASLGVRNACKALDCSLLKQRLGTADEAEVNRAREGVTLAEQALSDLIAIKAELPDFKIEGLEELQNENARAAKARLEQDRQAYEAQREAFEKNYNELARDNDAFKRASDGLFEAARTARMVSHVRTYFRGIRNRNRAERLQRY